MTVKNQTTSTPSQLLARPRMLTFKLKGVEVAIDVSAADNPRDLVKMVTDAFDLENVYHLRFYSSSQPNSFIPSSEILKNESYSGVVVAKVVEKVFITSGNSLILIKVSDCFSLGELISRIRVAFNLQHIPDKYIKLFSFSDCLINGPLLDLVDTEAPGLTITSPIVVKLFDKMLFEYEGSQRSVSIVGCDNFDELVGRVVDAWRLEIPEKYVRLYSNTIVEQPISLSDPVPDLSVAPQAHHIVVKLFDEVKCLFNAEKDPQSISVVGLSSFRQLTRKIKERWASGITHPELYSVSNDLLDPDDEIPDLSEAPDLAVISIR
jgi:hypothetical protein